MNKLEEITAGEVIVDGHNLTDKHIDINKVRENVGMVFQHFNLFPHMNVTQNLMLAPVELKKLPRMKPDSAPSTCWKKSAWPTKLTHIQSSFPVGRNSV